jgi:hypothetical protein
VAFKGTDSVWDALLDISIFADYSTNQYLEILLSSFYSKVHILATAISGIAADGRPVELIGHSLGAMYAWNVYHRLATVYPTIEALVSRVTMFNPYCVRDTAYSALLASTQAVRDKFVTNIIDGDFASIQAREHAIMGQLHIYDQVDSTHDDNDQSLWTTLREFMAFYSPTNVTRSAYVNITNHSMSNWTADIPRIIRETIELAANGNTRRILTEYKDNMPSYGLAHPEALYMTNSLQMDVHTAANADDPRWNATISITNDSAWTIQTYGYESADSTLQQRYINFPIALTYPTSSVDVTYSYHGDSLNGEKIVHFQRSADSAYLGLRDLTFANIIFPQALDAVTAGQYSADIDNSLHDRYDMIVRTLAADSGNSTRRSASAEVAIGFTFNSVIPDYDTYDIQFALYDTGGGNLKWGHIDVGSYDNYKMQLSHESGDDFVVHSNQATLYSPTWEIVHWDTNRYTIRNTDSINSGQYLKRPTPADVMLIYETRVMMYQNNTTNFMELSWETWDGLTGSPDDFVFEIIPFVEPIPRRIGNALYNYDPVSGSVTGTSMFFPQYMKSANEEYTLVFGRDGNLVLFNNTNGNEVYTSGTHFAGNGLFFQSDGNLVIYDGGSKNNNVGGPVRWASGTGASGTNKRILYVTDSGTIRITDENDTELWIRPS